MPIPLLIPAAIGIVALLAIGTAVTTLIIKKLDGKRVAILGGPQTGKSKLLQFLANIEAPTGTAAEDDQTPSSNFEIKFEGKSVKFDMPKDLSGDDGLGFPAWHAAFVDADYVWYLFRSDLIAQGDPDEVRLVNSHLSMFKEWSKKKSKSPKIILIGTWADQSDEYLTNKKRFIASVRRAEPIKLGAVKLGKAPVVVGSLSTKDEAESLIRSIASGV